MSSPTEIPRAIADLVERSLDVEWLEGAATAIAMPHSTGWRTLPFLVTAHIVNGEVRLEIEGASDHRVASGQALCLAAGVHHRATLVSSGQAVSEWSHVRLSVLGGIDVARLVRLAPVLPSARSGRIGAINCALAETARAASTLARAARRRALGFELLSELLAGAQVEPGALSRLQAAERMAPALALVRERLGESITLNDLARSAGLSASRFHARFKEALGMAPLVYVRRERLRRSQELLIGSDLAIAEVATRSGFPDPFHFSRLFKRSFGLSPLGYRGAVRSGGW